MIVWVIEISAGVLLFSFILTQILIPLHRGTPRFPLFRREHQLDESLAHARESVREARTERRIQSTLERAEGIRKGSLPKTSDSDTPS